MVVSNNVDYDLSSAPVVHERCFPFFLDIEADCDEMRPVVKRSRGCMEVIKGDSKLSDVPAAIRVQTISDTTGIALKRRRTALVHKEAPAIVA